MLAVVITGCALGGCASSAPDTVLPSLAKDPRPVLTADEQKAAHATLAAKKEAERAAALKKIETRE